ncbi:hypothetical protein [Cellulomonas rhizosphaerae]|uniref:Uncharacterized protein n=1 Tax=Cellulomonas rhizosphaerae TaxID=2293719 RepID=A0A413RN04_9CELL|nr:hypothetical protein [Cellulomonas rhizosphaerae]RHA42634.1 hypothetical protein D1825_07235 [Cellulomonas rhizosphaerae]
MSLVPATASADIADDVNAVTIDGLGGVWSELAEFDTTVPAVLRFAPVDGGAEVEWSTQLTSAARPEPTVQANAFLDWRGTALTGLAADTGYGARLTFPDMASGQPTAGLWNIPLAHGTVTVTQNGVVLSTFDVGGYALETNPTRVQPLVVPGELEPARGTVPGAGSTPMTFSYSGDENFAPSAVTVPVVDPRGAAGSAIGEVDGDASQLFAWVATTITDEGWTSGGARILEGGRLDVSVDGRLAAHLPIDPTAYPDAADFSFRLGFTASAHAVRDATITPGEPTTVTLPGLSGGRHTLTVAFSGSASAKPSTTSTVVVVPRASLMWQSVSVSRSTVHAGGRVVVAARLMSLAPIPVQGVPVAFQRQLPGSTRWTTVAHATSDSSGLAAVQLAVPRSARFRVVSSGTASLQAVAASAPKAVHVTRALSTSTSARQHGVTRISVRVTPTDRVYLQVQRNGAWHTIRTASPRAAGSSAAGTTHFDVQRTAHRQVLRVYVRSDSKASAASRKVAVAAR